MISPPKVLSKTRALSRSFEEPGHQAVHILSRQAKPVLLLLGGRTGPRPDTAPRGPHCCRINLARYFHMYGVPLLLSEM